MTIKEAAELWQNRNRVLRFIEKVATWKATALKLVVEFKFTYVEG